MRIAVPDGKGRMKVIHDDSPEYEQYREAFERAEMEYYEELVEEWEREKRRRVLTYYEPWKASLIFEVEQAWEHYQEDGDFMKVFKLLKTRVHIVASTYADNWGNWRLSYTDFEEALWYEVARIVKKSYNGYSDFYLYETVNKALDRRCMDVVRKATKTKQGRFEHSAKALPLDFEQNYPSPENIESDVTNRVLVNQILNDPVLTKDEREFLKVYYDNPGTSFQQLADALGYKHRENTRRVFARIKKKLVSRYPGVLV